MSRFEAAVSDARVPAAGRSLLIALVALVFCLVAAHASANETITSAPEGEEKVFTDGHLRPGRFETIRVRGFPGKGKIEVTFLPTAICENSCGALPCPGGKTNSHGAAKFRVRVPGTFFDHKNKRAYFRNGERIDLEVLWSGPDHAFDVGGADPDPILVRTHAPVAVASPSTPATFRGARLKQALLVPSAFQLQSSNGYSFVVLGAPGRKGRSDGVEIFVSGVHDGVIYSAPATVTETSIQADLGELGEISVTFHPSGQPATARPKCGGKPVSFDSGYYEGRIDFHGEEGYTEVEATSVPGSIDFLLNALCGAASGGGSGPFVPGAELRVRNPRLGPEFRVIKNRPNAPARFDVAVSEYRWGISIERFTTLLMPAQTFRYDPRLQTATLRPPAPFAGAARFDRRRKASHRWSGDLSVDMPGRADVPLTGSELRATLVHPEWDNGME
jgi:hypothetical protein